MTSVGWDVIVVGAGSAGAALAVRSAEQGKRVLLLDAGPDYRSAQMHEAWRSPNPAVALMDPAAAEGLLWTGLNSSRTDKQRQAPYWRGRGAGGSSSVNGQIAIRPPMADFEGWSGQGCSGWSAQDVLPYFAKLEDDEQFGDEPYHGRGGPTPIHRMPQEEWGGVDTALARSALAAGFGWAPDVNAPDATGVSPYPINSRDGRRVSVNDAYLEPARDLNPLTVRGDALVDRVLFEGNRAVGVQLVSGGRVVTEHADTVVLSAGVIHSPAILLRSGVGPAEHLRTLGIDVRHELPVGLGMQDHPMALVSIPLTDAAAVKSPHDRHTNVCVRWTSGPGAPQNDVMFVSLNQNVLAMATASTSTGSGAFGVWLNQNHSRGVLRLTSTDPEDQPLVRQRMLSDERDLALLRHGVRTLVGLALRPEAAAITEGSVEKENEALFAVLDSDSRLDGHLLDTVVDAQHGTSTCRMGAADDPGAVVDSECRVLGVEGLRVVDASVFPSVPRANTNLATIMAGELMADRIA
ncbi:GMC family oxidoreductase N-terminal domain-containing protein [Streptomyces sp. NBC_01186]|uniref:GMC family oxidoreductase n=1 Tax=unclassified Streptomyces TaxID=2593676 RepID=UPI002DDC8B54|nr:MULTISPECIES: GMC family oxidoreductase N-terminal domain-containing protein [unclassified Streptomyces]WSB75106.1 GMC family oxidoreductase N-terminal domain-containing protein [Streptomyces sp. NBC_01775]WSS16611.1 GMC family oxidoreductase N-terminal domain-containing protein [Streptomyces sp. NBC_01186]